MDEHEGDASTASTGDAQVDTALGRLAELDSLPVREHAAVFDSVHRALQDRLTADDAAHTVDEHAGDVES